MIQTTLLIGVDDGEGKDRHLRVATTLGMPEFEDDSRLQRQETLLPMSKITAVAILVWYNVRKGGRVRANSQKQVHQLRFGLVH
jgi:hypothetical protein